RDANNCLASVTRTLITVPDLVETAASIPDSTVIAGGTLNIADTASNTGTASARSSTTRFYLSADAVLGADDSLLGGKRDVAALDAGTSSAGSVTATVPAGQAAGTYRLLACAYDTRRVIERDETNNCRATGSTVEVLVIDLVESALSEPPA